MNSTQKQQIKRKIESFVCEVCSIEVTSQDVLDCHIKGQKHVKRLRQLEEIQSIKQQTVVTINDTVKNETESKDKIDQIQNKSYLQQLFELANYYKLKLTYEIIKESGPCHNRIFEVKCSLNDLKTNELIQATIALGPSINKAKNSAAELALKETNIEKLKTDKNVKKSDVASKHTQQIVKKITISKENELRDYEDQLTNYNKRQLLAKNAQLQLDEKQIQTINSILIQIETALKKVSDKLFEASNERQLEAVVRVGNLVKNTFLKTDRDIELVVLMSLIPTCFIIKQISNEFETILKESNDNKYLFESDDNIIKQEASIRIKSESDDFYIIKIMFTSMLLTNNLIPTTDISIDKCKQALTSIMRLKWFNAKLKPISNSILILRLVRDLCRRSPTWSVLTDWLLELIVDKCFYRNKYEELAKKFRTFFELISSGCLLLSKLSIEINSNGCLSFLDPCTNLDAFETVLTSQQCEDLTASAQHAIRLLTFKRINEILAL